jgi:hypothetical protein
LERDASAKVSEVWMQIEWQEMCPIPSGWERGERIKNEM